MSGQSLLRRGVPGRSYGPRMETIRAHRHPSDTSTRALRMLVAVVCLLATPIAGGRDIVDLGAGRRAARWLGRGRATARRHHLARQRWLPPVCDRDERRAAVLGGTAAVGGTGERVASQSSGGDDGPAAVVRTRDRGGPPAHVRRRRGVATSIAGARTPTARSAPLALWSSHP